MAKKFIVNAAQAPTSSLAFPPKSLAVVVLPSLVAVVVVTQYLEDHKLLLLLTAVSMAFVMILIGILLLWGDKSEGLEVSLSVNQLSVQVSTSRRGKIIGYPVLIDRKDILDIVVNEVILSHKVVSVVVLRILLKSTETAARPQEEKAQQLSMQTLLKEGNVKLQVAFPGVEMSYMECVTMRREICKALDL